MRLSLPVPALGFALVVGAPLALAQSVTGSGELSPGIPAPPLATWNPGSPDLTIGDAGTGTLTIAAGGTVSISRFAYIANQAGSTGALTVTGPGSRWDNDQGNIHVGYEGTGTLTVEDGGAVSTGFLQIGNRAGSDGTVTVTGPNSSLNGANLVSVGEAGIGSLTIADGATVSSSGAGTTSRIGVGAGGNGTATVTGTGSRWIGASNFSVGHSGTGTLRVENGGVVESSDGRIGVILGGNGTVTVTGTGSRWTMSSDVVVGWGGTGSLIIENGGAVSSGSSSSRSGTIGFSAGGSGSVTVTGTGSSWTMSRDLFVGRQGTGSVTVANGGTVSSRAGVIGEMAGGSGTVTVTGSGSTWTNSGELTVGNSGTGTLTIEAGGTVSNTNGYIGRNAGSIGTVTVTGAGSTWTNSGVLRVGFNGTGTLTIEAGGKVSNTLGLIGANSGSGTVTVTGAGSTWSNSGQLHVGVSGTGTLTVENGGNVTSTEGVIGSNSGSTGTATVTGAGSTWTNSAELHVGTSGTGTLTIADGGTVTGTMLFVGTNTGGTGTVTVTGAGSRWTNSGPLHVGFSGTGTLTVENGGKVSALTTTLATHSGSSGTLDLLGDAVNGRGVLETGQVIKGAGTVTLNLDGGILRATRNEADYLSYQSGFTSLTLGANGVVFDSNGYDIGVSTDFHGSGGLTKAGAGTLVLSGTNSYSGATTVSGGTLQAGVAGAFSANSAFTVASGARLDLAGFSQTIGSLAGAGMVTLGSGSLTAGGDNSSTSFSGAITGTGGLTKAGTGTLTLSGTNTYGGGTTVSGGKLVVNGSLASMVTLDGGTLGGSGTTGGVSVASGATVAPGNSIGTLTVSGNVAFASGSIYQVEVNAAGQSDRIVATGLATLAGGTVQVLAETGNYAASTNYTILTAAGGVTGRFSTVTSNLVFLEPSLAYNGNNVVLTMTRTATSFGPDSGTGGGSSGGFGGGSSGGFGGGSSGGFVAATRNQGFIAVAAEALGVGNPIYDTLLSGTAAEARAGFDLLSGEAHAQGVAVMIDESRLVRETILSRLRGPLLTQPGGQVAAAFSADLPGRKGAVLMSAPVPQPRYALWGEAFGGAGNTDTDGNAASLSRRSGGALLGADLMLYDNPGSSLRVGVAGGYSQSRFDLDARRSSGKLESGHAALYAGARFGNLRLDAGLAYTWSESDIRRQVQIRGFGDSLRLQRPGAVAQGFAELGYGFAFNGFALEPFAQLALIRVSTDAGTEQGGAAALRVLSSDQVLGFTTLGLRAEAQIGAAPLFARAMLGWRHGFGELTPQAKTAFALGTTPARVFAAEIDREALVAEAGLDWRISSATALGLTYSAAIGERSRDHALKGRVEMRF